jgi:hypothetical protein
MSSSADSSRVASPTWLDGSEPERDCILGTCARSPLLPGDSRANEIINEAKHGSVLVVEFCDFGGTAHQRWELLPPCFSQAGEVGRVSAPEPKVEVCAAGRPQDRCCASRDGEGGCALGARECPRRRALGLGPRAVCVARNRPTKIPTSARPTFVDARRFLEGTTTRKLL